MLRAVKVNFIHGKSDKEYTYQTELDVKEGDFLRAPMSKRNFITTVLVKSVEEIEEPLEGIKFIEYFATEANMVRNGDIDMNSLAVHTYLKRLESMNLPPIEEAKSA